MTKYENKKHNCALYKFNSITNSIILSPVRIGSTRRELSTPEIVMIMMMIMMMMMMMISPEVP